MALAAMRLATRAEPVLTPVLLRRRTLAAGFAASMALLLAGCGSTPPLPLVADGPTPVPANAADGSVLGRSERFIIYRSGRGDTLRSIAARFLGSAERDWMIGDFNGISAVLPQQVVAIPLKPVNPIGVRPAAIQTVPVLCYHRFGPGNGKMSVPPERFAAQLEWLARNDYRVVRLSQLTAFLEGREALPQRAVVITIDDGYESVYRQAWPLLKRYGFPATVFVYTDFIGAGDALNWSQLAEMSAGGLVEIQAHSKTHRNLIERLPGETDEQYAAAIDAEIRGPREQLERRLGVAVRNYAFPYGDANDAVLAELARERYQLAVTVHPGGNAFYAQPLMLRRTMIFGDFDLDTFKARLQIARPVLPP
jgi:peptidoglycan/xylan/chitin deacetylase (PgdA/CDA1 family)